MDLQWTIQEIREITGRLGEGHKGAMNGIQREAEVWILRYLVCHLALKIGGG